MGRPQLGRQKGLPVLFDSVPTLLRTKYLHTYPCAAEASIIPQHERVRRRGIGARKKEQNQRTVILAHDKKMRCDGWEFQRRKTPLPGLRLGGKVRM